MAKWGEGDPRWIVEERADATNVNNWHWSEKNATPWSKTRLTALLEGLTIEDGPVCVTLGSVKKLDGEATANNRKAKLIFLYEWEIKIDFIGRVSGSDIEYKGSIEIPNLSDENDASEIDINTSLDTKGPHEPNIRQLLNQIGLRKIQDVLATYIRELKEEFSKGLILPTDKVKPQVVSKGKTTLVDKKSFQNMVITDHKIAGLSKENFDVKTVSVSDTFKVTPDRLFEVLSEIKLVQAWANGCVEWDFREGGKFALFGGSVSGMFIRIDVNSEIEVSWRLKSYPEGHYANIIFRLNDEGDSTSLVVTASEVPSHKAEETQNGLMRYYVASIARTFGFSSRMS
uniref:Aha1_N domain-containing protein n=1 Tax=Heterorhabditis bacteriophora TaxID=37862 RepID=A0A1I7XJA0_HETBA